MQNKIIALVAIVALALGGFALYKALNIQFPLGSGSDFYAQFLAGIQTGSINYSRNSAGVTSATISGSSTSTTLTANQVCSNAILSWTATVESSTTTLPSYAALKADCLKNIGDVKRLILYNAGTATTTVNLIAGASSTIDYVATSSLSGLNLEMIEFINFTTTNGNNMLRVLVYPGQL